MGPLCRYQDLLKSKISPYSSDIAATQPRDTIPAICNASMTITWCRCDRDSRKCHALRLRPADTRT